MEEVKLMKTNYHTHTYRCGHALKCLDEEYVIKAIENNYNELGFTEHAMFSDIYNDYGMRPPYTDLEEYISTISSLKEKYKEKIKIYIGMECEYFKEYHDELKELLDSKKMDYLIFGNHYVAHKKGSIYTPSEIWGKDEYIYAYIKRAKEAMESKLFRVFAHPDFLYQFVNVWNENIKNKFKEVLEIAKENNVAIEINLGGFRRGIRKFDDIERYPFPYDPLWEIVKEVGNKVVIGVDSHNPKEFDNHEEYQKAVNFAKKHNIKVEERIEI